MGGGCANLAAIMQYLTSGFCSDLCVGYQHRHICAVKGSSVVIPCAFCYPETFPRQGAKRVMWGHERSNIHKGPFIFDSELRNTSTKLQYFGDTHNNCSFKIHQVDHNDTGRYTFRFVINDEEGKFTGADGSTLQVTDLHISVGKPVGEGQMKEGESVNLTCNNSCDGGEGSSAISWFKDGEHINEGPVLHLNNLTSTSSSGSYACSLKNDPGTLSGVVHVSVGYGPKDTSVSVRPSTEVDISSNITLTCRSSANPPVENYTWFAITDGSVKAVGHEPELNLAVSVLGDGGQYLCSVTNKHGRQNSSAVILKRKGMKTTSSRRILVIAAVAMFLIVAIGFAIIRLVKKTTGTQKNDSEENIQSTPIYANWAIFDQSQDEKEYEGGRSEVTYATVHIRRMANTEQWMDSNPDVDGVIYSKVCRSQNSNPSYVQRY